MKIADSADEISYRGERTFQVLGAYGNRLFQSGGEYSPAALDTETADVTRALKALGVTPHKRLKRLKTGGVSVSVPVRLDAATAREVFNLPQVAGMIQHKRSVPRAKAPLLAARH